MAETNEVIASFLARWQGVTGPERANYQLFLGELAAALDLPAPEPAEADDAALATVAALALATAAFAQKSVAEDSGAALSGEFATAETVTKPASSTSTVSGSSTSRSACSAASSSLRTARHWSRATGSRQPEPFGPSKGAVTLAEEPVACE